MGGGGGVLCSDRIFICSPQFFKNVYLIICLCRKSELLLLTSCESEQAFLTLDVNHHHHHHLLSGFGVFLYLLCNLERTHKLR